MQFFIFEDVLHGDSPSIREGIEVDEFGRKLIHEQRVCFLFSVVLFVRLIHCVSLLQRQVLPLVPCQIVVDMQKNLNMIRCISLFVR